MFTRSHLVFFFVLISLCAASGAPASAQSAASGQPAAVLAKLDRMLQKRRADDPSGTSRVIMRLADTRSLPTVAATVAASGGSVGRRLAIIDSWAVTVPNRLLAALANNAAVGYVSLDRPVAGAMERTGATVGATAVRQKYGYDGYGIGVAIIDSGVAPALDDLTDASGASPRIDRFVDFVNGRTDAYDDYGHGTHVAGIVAGNGFDSSGARTGIAPAARLTVLKVLDDQGHGQVSDVIAALDYVAAHKDELNIRIVNLSVAAAVHESFETDPLTLAARALTSAGIVVVAAAGNSGHAADGRTMYGGITAPGNAPWVLTVGASSHMGTIDRSDDQIAVFSSRGPTAVDYSAKPDLVAPGVGIESLSDPAGTLYTTDAAYLLDGTIATSYHPYLSLSGTSMASPVVAGTVALMLQANPLLTPNAVKAILQYTAQIYPSYDPLTEGAGFLNAKGAVDLARFLFDPAHNKQPKTRDWSRQLIWGTHQYQGGELAAAANAWNVSVPWGSPDADGLPVSLGTLGSQPWTLDTASSNVVWGSACGGTDCPGPWTVEAVNESDTVVWGTGESDTVVWGTDQSDTVVWGTSCDDASCVPVVWSAR
jgi:serine protease AprX